MIQRCIMEYLLYRCDGEFASGLLLYLICDFPGYIHRCKGGVVAKCEPVGVGRLPMFEPGILLGVAEEKLYLEAGVIDKKDISCTHVCVGAEHDFSQYLSAAIEFSHHDLDFSLERLAFDYGTVDYVRHAIHSHRLTHEHILPEIVDVDHPVKLLLAAAAAFLLTGVEILQDGIVTQPAHDIKTERNCPRHKVITCKKAVPHKYPGDFLELIPLLENSPEAFGGLIVALILHMLQIEWRTATGGQRKSLLRKEESGVILAGHNLSETQYLHTTLGRASAPRPVVAQTRSILSGLAQIAVVERYCAQLFCLKGQRGVETAPVEILFEVLSEATLTGLAMACKRQEIYPSICCQYQTHCLDDETFETFSYLRIHIERRGDDRTYLVKRLKYIHNSLIYNYKVTNFWPLGQIFQALILLKFKELNMFYSIFYKVKFLTNYC